MANLTITVNEDVLKRARIRALEQGTSVNRILGEYLRAYAESSQIVTAVAHALDIATKTTSGSGPRGREWRREDLYDR